jgi:hypothetical protein
MKWKTGLLGVAVVAAVLGFHQACSDAAFDSAQGSASGFACPNGNQICNEFRGPGAQFTFQTSYAQGKVWVVTPPPTQTANLVSLDPSTNYAVTTWNYMPAGASVGGSRTYVTPIGLVFARLPAQLFVVRENTPTTQMLTPVWQGAGANGSNRACVVSYQIGNVDFVGIAWVANGTRMFTHIQIDPNSTTGLNLSTAQDVALGADPAAAGIGWAYSCFVDQARNYFWAAPAYGGSVGAAPYGVNLKTMTGIDASAAPNAGHVVQTDASLAGYFGDPATGNGSYAMAGDAYGDVLIAKPGGSTMYTFAHETQYDLTYETFHDGTPAILVYPAGCSTGTSNCTGKVASINTSGSGSFGPLGSLNNGQIVGIVRGNPSLIYLIQPNDPKNPSSGVTATKIAQITGDAYMYTDFTGATLYPKPNDLTVDLRTLAGYNPKLPFHDPGFKWLADGGIVGAAWTGLVLSVRCFNDQTAGTTYMQVVNQVAPSGSITPLRQVSSCEGSGFDHIEVSVEGTGGNMFSHVVQVQVGAQQ